MDNDKLIIIFFIIYIIYTFKKNCKEKFTKYHNCNQLNNEPINTISKNCKENPADLVYCATKGQSANESDVNYWMVRMIKKDCSGKYYENIKYIGNNTWQISYDGKSFPEKIAVAI